MKRTLVCVVCLFLLSFPLFGQSSSPRTFRSLLIYHGIEPEKMKASLTATLLRQELPLTIIPSELPESASGEELSKETQRFACDSILKVTILEKKAQNLLSIEWSLSSTQENKPRLKDSIEKETSSWSDSADIFWLFLIEPLQDAFSKPLMPWPKPIESKKGSIAIQALPGTELKGLGKESLFVPESGRLDVELELPKTVELQGVLFSHRTQSQLLFIENSNSLVRLEQTPMPIYSILAYFNNFSFPAAMFEYSYIPGRAFVRGGIDQFFGGIYLSSNRKAGTFQWPVTSLPLFFLSAGTGYYFSAPDDFVRFYSTVDVSLRFMVPQWKYFGFDSIIPVQLQTMVGADIRLWEGGTWFFELGPTFYYVTDAVVANSLRTRDSSTLFFQLFESPIFTEIPFQAKAGYRWSF